MYRLTKNTNPQIRKAAYGAYAQLINSLAKYQSNSDESILCSLFDDILAPLLDIVIKNSLSEEVCPELIHYVIELFGRL